MGSTHNDKSAQKPDLRKNKPGATVSDLEEKFAGDENRNIMPKSQGRMVSPDPGNVVDGQTTKSN